MTSAPHGYIYLDTALGLDNTISAFRIKPEMSYWFVTLSPEPAGGATSARVAMFHTWPDGSTIRPTRSPQNVSSGGSRTLAPADTARSMAASTSRSEEHTSELQSL